MTYAVTIITGLIFFPFVAALFTVPYALYEYHTYGAISKTRTLVIYSFILYMLIAYFLVTLPLPDRDLTVGNLWQDHLSLVPFTDIAEFWNGRPFNAENISAFAKSFALWQILFNILLTVPFGVYLRYYFKQSFVRTVIFSFGLSLFFELTQLSALYGLYPGPYRLAAVEDLITNTLGGALGWQLAFVVTLVLPSRDAIDEETRIKGKHATGKRRFWASVFDYLVSDFLFTFIAGGIVLLFPQTDPLFEYGVGIWTLFCILGIAQALATKGTTLGHAICRMTLISEDGSLPSGRQIVKRYVLLWLFVELPSAIGGWLMSPRFEGTIGDLGMLAIIILSNAYPLFYLFNELLRKGMRPMPHDTLSGTTYIAVEIPEKN